MGSHSIYPRGEKGIICSQMFKMVSFVRVKNYSWVKYSSAGDWKHKLWYIHTL